VADLFENGHELKDGEGSLEAAVKAAQDAGAIVTDPVESGLCDEEISSNLPRKSRRAISGYRIKVTESYTI
jgi:hypothetical protein